MIPLRKASSPAIRRSSPSRATGPSSRSGSRSRPAPRAGTGDQVSTSPRRPCSGTSGSTPRRSTRARTSLPTPPSPSTELVVLSRGEEAAPRHERPEDRQQACLRRRGRGYRPRAVFLRHPQRSASPRLEAGRERLAHRLEQPSDERTDRHRTRARGRGRTHDRDTATSAPLSPRPSRSRPPQAPSSRLRSSP